MRGVRRVECQRRGIALLLADQVDASPGDDIASGDRPVPTARGRDFRSPSGITLN